MTTETVPQLILDPKVVERLAALVCGDDTPHHRSVRELTAFFEAAGWTRIEEYDAGSRFVWVCECIMERRQDVAAVRQLVLRIADPREYLDEPGESSAVLKELNEVLSLEGVVVKILSGRPTLLVRPESEEENPLLSKTPLELTADLAKVVHDEVFGQQLTARLDEARLCYTQGAPIAAVIMLGSVLEGVLYAVASDRKVPGERMPDRLQDLIKLAGEREWFTRDIFGYADELRDQRNLVHPTKQQKQGYAPDSNSARIAWNVVVAALNCLAALDPPPNAAPPASSRPGPCPGPSASGRPTQGSRDQSGPRPRPHPSPRTG